MTTILHYDDGAGKTYETTYDGWLKLFQAIAEAPNGSIIVRGAPHTWNPLIRYLGGELDSTRDSKGPETALSREWLEWACAREPVLVDALWRADMRWSGDRRHVTETTFNISTYSGFFRPEVLSFIRRLKMLAVDRAKIPTRGRRCVIVPCAADKPYPSPLHKAVADVAPDYEIIVATSVLGLVPQALWSEMPTYDAGLPYFERVADLVLYYFTKVPYQTVINYTDMLQSDVERGLYLCKQPFVTPVPFSTRTDYQPLMSTENLARLKKAADEER